MDADSSGEPGHDGGDAIGWGANPAHPGTPGGGSGGAICNDGNLMTLTLCGAPCSGGDLTVRASGGVP